MSIAAGEVRLQDVDPMDEDLFADGPPHELFARMRLWPRFSSAQTRTVATTGRSPRRPTSQR